MAEGATDTIQFDLPDDIDDFVKSRDLEVRVRVNAIDIDGTGNNNDLVDISPVRGETQFYDSDGIDLAAGPLDGGQEVFLDASGNADGVSGDQNDGRLTLAMRSSLTPYFVRNILGTQELKGNCLGGVTELDRPCLQ